MVEVSNGVVSNRVIEAVYHRVILDRVENLSRRVVTPTGAKPFTEFSVTAGSSG